MEPNLIGMLKIERAGIFFSGTKSDGPQGITEFDSTLVLDLRDGYKIKVWGNSCWFTCTFYSQMQQNLHSVEQLKN